MHMLLPDRAVLLLPDIGQQQLVYVEPQPVRRPLVVQHTTVFAPRVSRLDDRLIPVGHAIVPASTLGVGTEFATALTGSGPGLETDAGPVPIATSGSDRAADAPEAPAPTPPPTGVPYSPSTYALDIGEIPAPTAPVMLRTAGSAVRPAEPRAAVPTKAERTPTEEELVRRLLYEYAGALERLDVQAAKSVFPGVDDKALKRAFEQISAQRLTLQSCGIIISGSTANARCQGSAAYHPKIGSPALRTASGEWTFDLSKKDTDWRIVNTLVR